jgi:hypothetical protein
MLHDRTGQYQIESTTDPYCGYVSNNILVIRPAWGTRELVWRYVEPSNVEAQLGFYLDVNGGLLSAADVQHA